MNIAVIGANGQTGQSFIKKAVSAGHTIHAGVRNLAQHKLDHQDPALTVFACEATNIEQVCALIKGCDAVVSVIGHVKGSPRNVQTDAITAIISAMKVESISRIVSLTGTGVRFKGDSISLMDRFLNLGIATIDPARIHDGITHAKILTKSDTDWTLLRVLKLQNTLEQPFTLTMHGPAKLITSRAEVAGAMLQILESSDYIRTSPIISN